MFSPMFSSMFSDMFSDAFGGAGGGWSPPTDTYPTAFSPTARGGVSTGFGIWADGGMRVVRHETSLQWLGIRTISGITSGQKISCWATVTGTAQDVGLGLGNASVDLTTYSGADANGFVLFGHVADVYHNGASVLTTTGTLSQNDRVRMDVDRVNNTVQWYKQTGGTGSYVSMGAALDISVLGSGVLYPVSNGYKDTSILTWDFGTGSETPGSGFTAGPFGPWGGWLLPHVELYFGADTTRMWEVNTEAGTFAPNVITGDPIGGWHGVNYARLLSTGVSSNRLEKTSNGVKLDATGGLKQLNHALSVPLAQPQAFSVMIRVDDASVRQIRAGYGTSISVISSGQDTSNLSTQRGIVRSTPTQATAEFAGSVRTFVITYDGASAAYMLDSDGNWIAATVGSGVANWTRIFLRLTAADAGIGTVRVMQIATAAITETEARNWQYWAVNNLEAATA